MCVTHIWFNFILSFFYLPYRKFKRNRWRRHVSGQVATLRYRLTKTVCRIWYLKLTESFDAAWLKNCGKIIEFMRVYFRALYIKGDAPRETKAWLEILEKITAVRMIRHWVPLINDTPDRGCNVFSSDTVVFNENRIACIIAELLQRRHWRLV